jgi:RNA polymerase sigma factor (sigma-70 family)
VRQPEELSDAALAISASQGSHSAFAALMRRHKGWLYQFIRRYVADRDDAYDIVQESFVAAWGAIGRFDPERPLEAWLRRIALNKCRDRARRQAVRRAALSLFGLGAAEDAVTVKPSDEADADSALRRLETAIAALPRQLKEPLVLTALEGLSHKEAGELLGINAKAVETRVYRAKRKLAVALDPSDLLDLTGER